jgi:hypothetical protein
MDRKELKVEISNRVNCVWDGKRWNFGFVIWEVSKIERMIEMFLMNNTFDGGNHRNVKEINVGLRNRYWEGEFCVGEWNSSGNLQFGIGCINSDSQDVFEWNCWRKCLFVWLLQRYFDRLEIGTTCQRSPKKVTPIQLFPSKANFFPIWTLPS